MNSLKPLVLGFICASALAASAQDSKIPKNPAEIQKMVMVRPVRRITTLPDAEKIKLIQTSLKGKTASTTNYSLTLPTKLDTRNSFIDGKAKMYLDWPSEVSAADNQVYFDHDGKVEPRIRLYYNAPAPGYYVFDFALENVDYGKTSDLQFVNLFVESLSKPFDKSSHQLFVTNIKTAGWNFFTLESKNTAWKFFSVEISQFK